MEGNYQNRINLLEMEINELQTGQDSAIERALNQARNEIKSRSEKSKEAMHEQLKLKKEMDLKDH